DLDPAFRLLVIHIEERELLPSFLGAEYVVDVRDERGHRRVAVESHVEVRDAISNHSLPLRQALRKRRLFHIAVQAMDYVARPRRESAPVRAVRSLELLPILVDEGLEDTLDV